MCGILGITADRKVLMEKACETLRHRGPDASGVYSDARVTLGHTRLSIIDLDSRSNQPFFDEEEEVGVVYNGEIYNYKTLRSELSALGHIFMTESDTEVLVVGYKEWGISMLEKLEGMFAFALYDTRVGKIILATDYSNIKPLYYARSGRTLIFASEMKGVLALGRDEGVDLRIDREALDLYWVLGYIPAPRTLYTNISRVPAHTWVQYDCETGNLDYGDIKPRIGHAVSTNELGSVIEQAILDHLAADVPVGVFFSGGTDSSLITAVLNKHNMQLETFSLQVAGRKGDEPYFRGIAQHLGLSSHIYTFGISEFDEAYTYVMRHLDEPLADNSLFPTYYISKKASKSVKVVLSGEGGDEYFFGYPRSVELLKLRGAVLDGNATFLDRLLVALPGFKGKSYLFKQLFLLLKQPVSYYLLEMSFGEIVVSLKEWAIAKKRIAESGTLPHLFDAELYLPDLLLRKTDIATMYASIEGRVPLLDARVIAAALATPQKPRKDLLKPLLKSVLATLLPKDLVYRGKAGFGLEPRVIFGDSEPLARDVKLGLDYLFEKGLLHRRFGSAKELLRSHPNMALRVAVLFRVLKNNETIYQG